MLLLLPGAAAAAADDDGDDVEEEVEEVAGDLLDCGGPLAFLAYGHLRSKAMASLLTRWEKL